MSKTNHTKAAIPRRSDMTLSGLIFFSLLQTLYIILTFNFFDNMKIFFTIGGWITISVIVAVIIFIIDYQEYKKKGTLIVNGREIVWSIIAVLAGPISVIFALIFLVACGAGWFFSLDWWTEKKVLIRKKEKRSNNETIKEENPSNDEGTTLNY